MALGLQGVYYALSREYPLATGQTFTENGMCAMAYMADGVIGAKPSAGASTDMFLGVVIKDSEDITSKAFVEVVTVPSSSPYTVQLTKTNLVATQIRLYDDTQSQALTEGSASNTDEYSVVDSTGIITFHSGQAGSTVTVQGRYNPTVAQVLASDWQRSPNQTASDQQGSVVCAMGTGTIFATDQYDAAQDYSPSSGAPAVIKTAASGLFSSAGSGVAIGRVYKTPDVDDPMLWIILN